MAIENMAFPPTTGFNMFGQSHHDDQDHLPSTSLNTPTFPSPHFHDNGNNNSHNNLPFFRRSMSFSGLDHGQEQVMVGQGGGGGGDDDLSDDGSQMMLGEKKKRLSLEQVKALEKSFEIGNKLEPERKVQLARALGLQPRQIAIWFQNRRARWKTKQLERDYEVLRKQCDALRSDNECLQAQNEKLHSELLALKRRYTNDQAIPKREVDQGSNWSNNGSCENSCEVNLDMSRSSPISNSGGTKSNGHLLPLSRPPMATQQFLHGHTTVVQEDSFCNMFGNGSGMEDNQAFWSWTNPPTDHHNQFH